MIQNLQSLCRYILGKFKEKGYFTSFDYEILAIIYCLNFFMLFICNEQEIIIRTDYEVIVKYDQQTKSMRKGLSTKRWINFIDTIINIRLKINWD